MKNFRLQIHVFNQYYSKMVWLTNINLPGYLIATNHTIITEIMSEKWKQLLFSKKKGKVSFGLSTHIHKCSDPLYKHKEASLLKIQLSCLESWGCNLRYALSHGAPCYVDILSDVCEHARETKSKKLILGCDWIFDILIKKLILFYFFLQLLSFRCTFFNHQCYSTS